MKQTLSGAAAKVATAAKRLPIHLAHLFGISHGDQRSDNRPSVARPKGRLKAKLASNLRQATQVPPEVPIVPARPYPAPLLPDAPSPDFPDSDDDDAQEMYGNSPVAQARRRERARCAAIVMSEAGLRNPNLAQALAFVTREPRSDAIRILQAAPASTGIQSNYWVGRPWVPEHALLTAPEAGKGSRPSSAAKRPAPQSKACR